MSKPKLLIYTDSEIFGGNEKLIMCLLQNYRIIDNYSIYFVYRKSANFIRHLNLEFGKYPFSTTFSSLGLLSNDFIYDKIKKSKLPVYLCKLLFFFFYILQKTNLYFFYNTFVQLFILKKIKPDIIHVFNGGYPGSDSCSSLVISAKILNVKKVVYQINNLSYKTYNPLRILFDKLIDYSTHNFIIASKQGAYNLEKNRYFLQKKIVIVPNTILSKNIITTRSETLQGYDYNSRPFVLISIGHLTKRKGHHFLLEAILYIKNNYPIVYSKLLLFVVGEGEETFNLKNFIADNMISDAVKLIGYKTNHLNYLICADLFVMPSIFGEDMPLTILEAMNNKKIIIASSLAGMKDQIENNVSGILIDLDKDKFVLNLAEKIVFVYNSQDLNYGLNAKIRFDKYFSNSIYADNLIKIYTK